MKNVLTKLGLILFTMSTLISCGGSSDEDVSKSTDFKMEQKTCSYCGKTINGSGVEGNYGEPYCDKYCFVDGN